MSAKEANLLFSLSPSLEIMPLQHDLLRFSKIGPPGRDKRSKLEKICVTVSQYYPPENGKKLKMAENQWFQGLKNQCGTKSPDSFHMLPSFEVILENFEVLMKIPW